jgi:opacity protein-like surface antigen
MKRLTILAALSMLAIGIQTFPVAAAPKQAQVYIQPPDITSSEAHGAFGAGYAQLTVTKSAGKYTYKMHDTDTDSTVTLTRGRLTRSSDKHFYEWNDSGTIYRVTWQPADPRYARLQIFDLRNRETFNQLMTASNPEPLPALPD